MKRCILMTMAAVALMAAAASCDKYDDSDLRGKIDSLESRVSSLENTVKTLNETTVPGIRTLVEALQNNVTVSKIESVTGGYVITFSDGSKANVSGIVGTTLQNGTYVWTVNGEVLKDASGNAIPVGDSSGPVFRANGDKLEVSLDGGATWTAIQTSEALDITIAETDTTYTISYGGQILVLAKEVVFTLNLDAAAGLSIEYGAKADISYSVTGVASGVTAEVDVLNAGADFDAEVKPGSGNSGVITLTNKHQGAGTVKVFVYAADHKGHSDIKAVSFTAAAGGEVVFEAVLNVQTVPAGGGDFVLDVKADEDYTVSVESAAQAWLSVTPPTRARYEDKLAVTVKANETTVQRSGTITLSSKASDKLVKVEVLQEAAEAAGPAYEDLLGVYTVKAKGKYNYYSEALKKWTVKNGELTLDVRIYPADGSEDYYVGALMDEYQGEQYISSYFYLDIDPETGGLYMVPAKTDEWESDYYGIITDWQYAYIEYQGSLYYVTGDYVIGQSEAPKDGAFTLTAGPQLAISGYSSPFTIVGVELLGFNSDNEGIYLYGDIPFPAQFSRTGDLPAASLPARLQGLNKRSASARECHLVPMPGPVEK